MFIIKENPFSIIYKLIIGTEYYCLDKSKQNGYRKYIYQIKSFIRIH